MLVTIRKGKMTFETSNQGVWDIVNESTIGEDDEVEKKYVLGYWLYGIHKVDEKDPNDIFLRCIESDDDSLLQKEKNKIVKAQAEGEKLYTVKKEVM